MPNKKWENLIEVDRQLRKLSPNKGMTEKSGLNPQIRVTLVRGFELFNTRSYHNYETWSDGYVAEAFGDDGQIIASSQAEDLDDVLIALEKKLKGG